MARKKTESTKTESTKAEGTRLVPGGVYIKETPEGVIFGTIVSGIVRDRGPSAGILLSFGSVPIRVVEGEAELNRWKLQAIPYAVDAEPDAENAAEPSAEA